MSNPLGSKYFKNLDSLRFFAFFGVFLCHCVAVPNIIPQNSFAGRTLQTFCYNGARGVQMFFVISGFIITYLLISEKIATGGISLKNFYFRRTLRIWPLFYLIIIYVFLIKPLLSQHFGIHWKFEFSDGYMNANPNPWVWSFFLGNFDIIVNGPPIQSELHLLWSLCVEEQFYILWPVILKFIKVRKIPYALCIGVLISITLRIFFMRRYQMLESNFNTFILFDFFAIGGLLAYLITKKEKEIRDFMNKHVRSIYELLFIGIVFFLIGFDTYSNNGVFETSFKYTFYAVVFTLFILCFEFKDNSMTWIKGNVVFKYLGKVSYGLYMYHMVVWAILFSEFKNLTSIWLIVLASLFSTILVSIGSFKFFETPFLNIARKYRKV